MVVHLFYCIAPFLHPLTYNSEFLCFYAFDKCYQAMWQCVLFIFCIDLFQHLVTLK